MAIKWKSSVYSDFHLINLDSTNDILISVIYILYAASYNDVISILYYDKNLLVSLHTIKQQTVSVTALTQFYLHNRSFKNVNIC